MSAALLSQLLNGLQYGLLLFLIASGLTLVFGVLGIINLAHGSLFMIGAYIVFFVVSKVGSLWIAIPVAVICGLALGALLERFLFRHFYDREHLDQVLLTFALILIFEEVRSLLVGNDFHSVPVPAILDFSVPITGTFSYAAYRLFVIAVCLAVAAVLFYWIERTKMGAIIRAAAEKPEIVDILGIDARRVHLVVFAVGAALAVMAGGLAAPLTSVYPNMGSGLLIISFVVVVVGGLGSVSGAFWAALLIGLIDTLGKAYGSSLVSLPLGQVLAALASMSVYIVMVAILLFRPTGLFGRRA
ncbi:branched-chain amino acid ABC transporter permease [Methylocella sp. CPCC 101449]|jgi:branched-chain amino acid transport system permease protein|uniref:branched-chain amino acid ABC transporter permease n=1 Tax=Methylocella sp. CPCC 101449 TaxID=2987531 RepID=UPI00288FC232|nr:branched-chain amino acid ABC transporter permease [Methylocella sp. CPCC 101449]MDT2019407.1 branched-chain amino acid ABC transporter permease [Methylocella sp. CPCC 101449]HEV2573195.1 branched-chain amino acid ABC transporter permease [Beijerinckiaceae bacterium]